MRNMSKYNLSNSSTNTNETIDNHHQQNKGHMETSHPDRDQSSLSNPNDYTMHNQNSPEYKDTTAGSIPKLTHTFDVLGSKVWSNDVPIKSRRVSNVQQHYKIDDDGIPIIPEEILQKNLAFLTEMANLAHRYKTKLVCDKFSWGPPIKVAIVNESASHFSKQKQIHNDTMTQSTHSFKSKGCDHFNTDNKHAEITDYNEQTTSVSTTEEKTKLHSSNISSLNYEQHEYPKRPVKRTTSSKPNINENKSSGTDSNAIEKEFKNINTDHMGCERSPPEKRACIGNRYQDEKMKRNKMKQEYELQNDSFRESSKKKNRLKFEDPSSPMYEEERDMFSDDENFTIKSDEIVKQQKCPICGKMFASKEIENHAANCQDFCQDTSSTAERIESSGGESSNEPTFSKTGMHDSNEKIHETKQSSTTRRKKQKSKKQKKKR